MCITHSHSRKPFNVCIPIFSAQYSWIVGSYGSCQTKCGQPQQTVQRSVQCQASTGAIVNDSLCNDHLKPPHTMICPATTACGNTSFQDSRCINI